MSRDPVKEARHAFSGDIRCSRGSGQTCARCADGQECSVCYNQRHGRALVAALDASRADLARVERERDEARAMFTEAHERQKRAERDCDEARETGRAGLAAEQAYWQRGIKAIHAEVGALRAFARRCYLAHCTPGCEALGPTTRDLDHLAERVEETAAWRAKAGDDFEAGRAEERAAVLTDLRATLAAYRGDKQSRVEGVIADCIRSIERGEHTPNAPAKGDGSKP